MRAVFALPAVIIPLALVALAAAVRRVAEAVSDLRGELVAASGLRREVASLIDDLDNPARRSGPRSRSSGPRQ